MQPPPLGASSLPASLHPRPQLLLPPAGFFPCHPYHQPPHALLQVITQYLNQAFLFLENSSPLAPAIPCCLPGSSAGKKSTCNAGDPGSIPGLGRSAGEGIGYPFVFLGFPCGSAGKESACNVGDLGLTTGLGRSPREGKGYPLQYSGLDNSMNCTVHGSQRVRYH